MANQSAAPLHTGDGFAQAVDALLVAGAAQADIGEALSGAGIRLRATVDPADLVAALDEPRLDILLLDARDLGAPALAQAIDTLTAPDAWQGRALVAAFAQDQIDLAAPLLGLVRAQLLCDPGPVMLLGALMLARADSEAPPRIRVHDITRDSEAARLRRLNEEVARIADALTRLTRGALDDASEFGGRGGIREPEMGYRGPDGAPPEIDAGEVRAVIRARRMRSQFFAPDLFADPAWDMLLDLFAASLERRRVSVSSLCIAAAVPPTTALRWIGTMHDAGLFGREADPGDRRRAYIVLSDKAAQGMRNYVGALRRAGLGLV